MISLTLVSLWNSLAQAASAALVAGLLFAFHRLYARRHLRYWAWSWLALGAQLALAAASLRFARESDAAEAPRFLVALLGSLAGYFQVAWLLLGAYEIASGREASRRVARALSPLLVAVSLA